MVQKYTQDILSRVFLCLNGRRKVCIYTYIYSYEAEAELGKAQIPVLYLSA